MRYTDSHEWIAANENPAKVGITSYAQKEIGEIVYAELPKVGQKMKAGEEICVLESTKVAADIYAPVSGEVTAVNETLLKNLHSLNQDPENHGWLFQIKFSDSKEPERLMTLDEYRTLVGK